jgi:hypothetical protein
MNIYTVALLLLKKTNNGDCIINEGNVRKEYICN